MKQILKYVININRGMHTIKVPLNSDLLKIDSQRDQIAIWIVGDPDDELVPVELHVLHTEEEEPKDMLHLATVLFNKGHTYVVHVYGKKK